MISLRSAVSSFLAALLGCILLFVSVSLGQAQGNISDEGSAAQLNQLESQDVLQNRQSVSLTSPSIALNLDWTEDAILLDWRPRFIPVDELSSDIDIFVGIDGVALAPAVATGAAPSERRLISSLAIDTGRDISAPEAAAFIRAANRIISLQLPGQEFSVALFSDTVNQIAALSSDVEILREDLIDIQKYDAESMPVTAIALLAQAMIDLPADRRAVYVFTDGQSCGQDQPVGADAYLDFYQSYRVIVHTVLFAETEPRQNCIDALTLISELTGGSIFTVDEEGKSRSQPQNSALAFGSGDELGFDLTGLRVPPGTGAKQIDIAVSFNGQSLSTAIEIEMPVMGWGEYLMFLLQVYAIETAVLAMIPAILFAMLALLGNLTQKKPPTGWLREEAGLQGPIVLGRKGVILTQMTLDGKKFKRVWVKAKKNGVEATSKSGSLLNGVPFKTSQLQNGDVLEIEPGVSYRYHAF